MTLSGVAFLINNSFFSSISFVTKKSPKLSKLIVYRSNYEAITCNLSIYIRFRSVG